MTTASACRSEFEVEWEPNKPEIRLPSADDIAAIASCSLTDFQARCEWANERDLFRDLSVLFDRKSSWKSVQGKRIQDLELALLSFLNVRKALLQTTQDTQSGPDSARTFKLLQCAIVHCRLSRLTMDFPILISDCQFLYKATVSKSDFQKPISIRECVFKGTGDANHITDLYTPENCFDGCTFAGCFDVSRTVFSNGVIFNGSRFLTSPVFNDTGFGGPVSFRDCAVSGGLSLDQAIFAESATLDILGLSINASRSLEGNLALGRDQLRPNRHRRLIPADNRSQARKETSAWQRRRTPMHQVQYTPQRLKEEFKAESRKRMRLAMEQYSVLAGNFGKRQGPDARGARDFCLYRYRDLYRITTLKGIASLVDLVFHKLLFGYGVRIQNVALTIPAVIVFFACLYSIFFSNLLCTHSPQGEVLLSESGPLLVRTGNALYFSAVSFTTIGYGDWHPIGAAKCFAATEGLLGVFLMAMFTVSLARRVLPN